MLILKETAATPRERSTKIYYSLRTDIPITRAEMEKIFAEADSLIARITSRVEQPPAAVD